MRPTPRALLPAPRHCLPARPARLAPASRSHGPAPVVCVQSLRTQEGQRRSDPALAFTERAQDLKVLRALRRNAGGSSRDLSFQSPGIGDSTVVLDHDRESRASHGRLTTCQDSGGALGAGQVLGVGTQVGVREEADDREPLRAGRHRRVRHPGGDHHDVAGPDRVRLVALPGGPGAGQDVFVA